MHKFLEHHRGQSSNHRNTHSSGVLSYQLRVGQYHPGKLILSESLKESIHYEWSIGVMGDPFISVEWRS